MRPASGTLKRGISSSSSGRRNRGSFQPDSGQYFEKFFLDQLRDIYYAEQKITQSLPKMQEAATKDAFEDHLHQTQRHCRRLEKAFEMLGQRAEGKKCEAIEGIVREAESIISQTEEGTMTRDAALIMAAQKVEHYEIATYGGLVQMAITMGQYEVAELLDRTLMEEEDTDLLLTEIAECEINVMAEFEGVGEEQGQNEEEGMEEEESEEEPRVESENDEENETS
jgi:ferritin-like metal-binding protein YciE